DVTGVRAFLGTAISTRAWVKNYGKIARPLQRLTGKVDWRWGYAESLSFNLLRNKCSTGAAQHGWDPALPVDMYTDAF
ncbi:hypothetical protein BU16DRAFT_473211, partial [Lophium mytilinum]